MIDKGVDPYAPETVAVYRLFNHYGALLYVGISESPKRRFQEHAASKFWWYTVHHWYVEWHADRSRALAAEAQAIVDEDPAYNSAGMPTSTMNGPEVWRGRIADGYCPNAVELKELFLRYIRMQSLLDGAFCVWDPDEAFEIYKGARRNASWWAQWRHRRYVQWWNNYRDEEARRSGRLGIPG